MGEKAVALNRRVSGQDEQLNSIVVVDSRNHSGRRNSNPIPLSAWQTPAEGNAGLKPELMERCMPVKQAEVGIKSPFDLSPLDLTGAARKAIENCANAQIVLLEDAQTTTRDWFDRVQAETDVASEFV